MQVVIVAPVEPGSTRGNGVTARRWARLLEDLGHAVTVQSADEVDAGCELLIALHARKSGRAVERFGRTHPGRPVVLAMTGTDLHHDLPAGDPVARQSVAAARRIVVLYEGASRFLPAEVHDRVHVIRQSATAAGRGRTRALDGTFELCVLAHLREVKDPLCAARALRHVPAELPVRVQLAGAAMEPAWEAAARAAAAAEPRFTWLGGLPAEAARALLERSHALVLSSHAEGGANVVSEAVVAGVPVLASAIPGNAGLLGAGYPALFPPGDDAALAALITRCAREPAFYRELERRIAACAPLFSPDAERSAWARLLRQLD